MKPNFFLKTKIYVSWLIIISFVCLQPVLLPFSQVALAQNTKGGTGKTVPESSNDTDPDDPGGVLGKRFQKLNESNIQQGIKSLDFFVKVANRKRISMNAFDRAELEKYLKLYAQLKANPDALAQYKKTGQIPQKLLEDLEIIIEPSNYDVRVLQTLVHLVTPKERGGAGREFIKISNIVKGYTSERKAKSGREIDPEQEAKDPEAHYSSHYKGFGQAADATEIDYLRGTRFVYIYEDGELKEVRKFKLPKIPIQVGWQTEERVEMKGSGPEILGQSMNKIFSQLPEDLLAKAVLNWLEDQGIDISLSKDKIKGKNAAQIVQELGLAWIKENYELPKNLDGFGYDLGSTGEKIGQHLLAETFHNIFPSTGFQGNSLDELLTNLGREYVARQMNLPYNSLYGNTAEELFANIGRSRIEDELGLIRGSLAGISVENRLEKIGQGYIEKTLSLPQGSFTGSDLPDLKNNLGSLKFNEIFENEKIIIHLLGIDSSVMEKLKDGKIKEFLKDVGKKHLARTVEVYQAKNSAFNLDLKGCFLGDNIDFKAIGYDVVAKALSTDQETREIIKNWFISGIIETEFSSDFQYGTPKIDQEYLAGQYKLAKNDLQRIFINDKNGNLRADEVFYRIGKSRIELALKNSAEENTRSNIKNNPSLDFYEQRIQNIKNEIQGIFFSNNQYIKNIQGILDKMENYQEDDFEHLIIVPKKDFILEKADEIQQELKQIQENYPQLVKSIRKNINEIIEGKEEIELSNLENKDLTKLNYDYYVRNLTKQELIKVFKQQESPQEAIKKIGLALLSDVFDFQEQDDLIKAYQKSPTAPQTSAIKRNINGNYLLESVNQINNILSSFGYQDKSYNLSVDDLVDLLAGKSIVPLFKIGGKVSNEAFGFLPGKGLKEYIEEKTNFSDVLKGGGLVRIYRFLSLSRAPEGLDNVQDNLSRAYAEEFLGLAKGGLKGNRERMIKTNGLERFLLALGIKIPEDIAIKRDFDPNSYQKDLEDFWKKLKDPDFNFWKNKENLSAITASVIGLNWNADTVKSIITSENSAKNYLKLVKEVIKDKIEEKQPDGTYALNDFLDLAVNIFDDYRINGDNKPDLGQIFNNLEKLTGLDLDSKLGFEPGKMAEILSNPERSSEIFLEQGIRTLSKIFVNDPAIDFLSKENLGIQYEFTINNPISVEKWNFFGLVYKDGLGKEIPIKVKIPLGGWQDKKVNFWNSLKDEISQFTKIPLDFGKDLERFLNGDAKGALLAWGAGQMADNYQKWLNDLNSRLPSGKTLEGLIDYDKIKKAYFDLLPSSSDFKEIITKAFTDPEFNLAKDLPGSEDITLNKFFSQKVSEFCESFKEGKRKEIQYALIDQAIGEKLGEGAPGPGFAKTIFEGKPEEKLELMKNWLDRTVNMPDLLEDLGVKNLSDLVDFFKDPQSFDLDSLPNNVFDNLDSLLEKWTGQQIPGIGKGLINYFANPNQTITLPGLGQINPDFLAGKITSILDNGLGLPGGTAETIWQSFQNYQNALTNYHKTIQNINPSDPQSLLASRQNILKAEQNLQLNSANFVTVIVNLVLDKTFAQIDQSLGLPSGTTSLLVNSIIYSVMVPGVALGAFLWPLLLPVLGQLFQDIPIIGDLLGGFFGRKKITTRTEIIYTACGYYPGFKHEQEEVDAAKADALESQNIEDWSEYERLRDEYDVVPSSEIEPGCPGEFHAENIALFKQGSRRASQYKIRSLLGNLLTMDEKTGNEAMIPTQLETWNIDDVAYWKEKRDEKYGYKDENGEVIPGSADQVLESGSRRGFGYNKTLIDRIHFAW